MSDNAILLDVEKMLKAGRFIPYFVDKSAAINQTLWHDL